MSQIDLIRAEINVNKRHADRYLFLSRNCRGLFAKKARNEYHRKALDLLVRNMMLGMSLVQRHFHKMAVAGQAGSRAGAALRKTIVRMKPNNEAIIIKDRVGIL